MSGRRNLLAEYVVLYKLSKKPIDNFWTEWCTRPFATPFLWALQHTRVTPNQVTFLSLIVFLAVPALLLGSRTWGGLCGAALAIQLSYIVDCIDGQLARLKKMTSPVGALLDFMMDEFKAFLLVSAATVRQWLITDDLRWLIFGIAGMVIVASGITLTTFMRRPEYIATVPVGAAGASGSTSPIARIIKAVETVGHIAVHYPTYFWLLALFDRLDLFLFVYLGAHTLYLGRASLGVLLRLARPVAP